MSTVAQSAATVNFDTTLLAAAARAKAVYPAERARIERGLGIVLAGGVDLLPDGTAHVASQTQEGYYKVNGRCSCRDEPHAPGGRCKHRWGKSLYKAALADQKRHAPPAGYWATYYAPDGRAVPGTATWEARGWLFTPEDGDTPFYAAIQALSLGGHIATAEAQREADGDLVARVCGYSTRGQ